jgi:hypothetical protein
LVVATVAAAAIPSVARSADGQGDALVFVGAGRVNGWETFFFASNAAAEELNMLAGITLNFPGGCSPSGCPGYKSAFLDGFASVETGTLGLDGLGVMYFWSGNPDSLPLVTGNTVNHANPAQNAEVPGVRLSTVLSRASAPLFIPNARGGDFRSNLVLANVHTFDQNPPRGGEIQVQIDAFAQNGHLLGSMTDSIAIGQSKMYQNVYEALGGVTADAGEIRVTRIGGDRAFWGVMYTIDPNGAIATSVPLSP